MKKILLVHKSLRPPGGANAVAARVVEALKDDYALTILTWNPVDAGTLNRFYGTTIRDGDFSVLYPPSFLRQQRWFDPDEGSLVPIVYLMQVCHRIRGHYDLVIGTGPEELDLGGTGLLYMHHPDLARFWEGARDCGGKPIATKLLYLLTGRTRAWMVFSDFSMKRLRSHTVLTNSDWTGLQVDRSYGMCSRTLYPPVPDVPSGRPWSERENSFLAAGRFSRRKRLDWIVSVLGRVRASQPTVRLHLAGTKVLVGDGPEYYRELQALAAANAAWVTIHENLSRQNLSDLVGRVRYGIHAKLHEHFGIAPAEALLAGCIPFMHDSGGQVEIVGRDPRLCFTTADDAVEKITAVIQDGDLQTRIRESLAPRKELFTCTRFVEAFREAVRRLIGD